MHTLRKREIARYYRIHYRTITIQTIYKPTDRFVVWIYYRIFCRILQRSEWRLCNLVREPKRQLSLQNWSLSRDTKLRTVYKSQRETPNRNIFLLFAYKTIVKYCVTRLCMSLMLRMWSRFAVSASILINRFYYFFSSYLLSLRYWKHVWFSLPLSCCKFIAVLNVRNWSFSPRCIELVLKLRFIVSWVDFYVCLMILILLFHISVVPVDVSTLSFGIKSHTFIPSPNARPVAAYKWAWNI